MIRYPTCIVIADNEWMLECFKTDHQLECLEYYKVNKALKSIAECPFELHRKEQLVKLHGIGEYIAKTILRNKQSYEWYKPTMSSLTTAKTKNDSRHDDTDHKTQNDFCEYEDRIELAIASSIQAQLNNKTNSAGDTNRNVHANNNNVHIAVKKNKQRYVPRYKSGAFAILLCLTIAHDKYKIKSMCKLDIEKYAQKFATSSFTAPQLPLITTNIPIKTAWNANETLIDYQYIRRMPNANPSVQFNDDYELTKSGLYSGREIAYIYRRMNLQCFSATDSCLMFKKFNQSMLAHNIHHNNHSDSNSNNNSNRRTNIDEHTFAYVVDDDEKIEDYFGLNQFCAWKQSLFFAKETNVLLGEIQKQTTFRIDNNGRKNENVNELKNPIRLFGDDDDTHTLYDLILVVDYTESDMFVDGLRESGVHCIKEKLSISDFIWILGPTKMNTGAKSDIKPLLHHSYVMPILIERKTYTDFILSIRDSNRYCSQKYRMMESNSAHKLMFFMEGCIHRQLIRDRSKRTVAQCMVSNEARDGFHVHLTRNRQKSLTALYHMTHVIYNWLKSKLHLLRLSSSSCSSSVTPATSVEAEEHYHNDKQTVLYNLRLRPFPDFCQHNRRTKPDLVRNLFLRHLLGIGHEITFKIAANIVHIYPTFKCLWDAWCQQCSSVAQQKLLLHKTIVVPVLRMFDEEVMDEDIKNVFEMLGSILSNNSSHMEYIVSKPISAYIWYTLKGQN